MKTRFGRLLQTRIARRLLVLFVLSAFLPLAVVAVMSLGEVRSMLLAQGESRLAANAKAYGMTLFERLQLAAEVAGSAAQSERVVAPGSLPARIFSSLDVVRNDRVVALLSPGTAPKLPAEARERLMAGKAAVFVIGDAPSPRIFLAAPGPSPATGYVVGAVRETFLWGPADELPSATEFCIVEEGTARLLGCSAPNGAPALGVLAPRGQPLRSAGAWDRDGDTMRARIWAQFMRVEFGTHDWLVIASRPERVVLARLFAFRELYVPIVALTLVLVMWLTIRQSRHIVEPVVLLAERARGIARNEFDGRLDLKRNDEFGELAGAFDHMAQRLGQQFASLTALSEIDRLMLSTQDTAEIVRTVLKRLAEVVPADLMTVTLFDHHSQDNARTYSLARGADEPEAIQRHQVSAADRGGLRGDAESWWATLEPGRSPPVYLAPALAQGMSGALVQPIVWREEICGALVLAYRSALSAGDEEKQRARELADRMAVAVSSAWRDEQLYAQAHFDALTGAPNRLLFIDRLDIEIARSEREALIFALLFVDLDHFKVVNDSFGHTAGDHALREAVARIQRCVRTSDTVSRLGGDEFTVLLTRLNHPQEAWLIAETIVEALSREFILDGQQYFLSASVGISTFPADGRTPETLLKSADTAMYRAKANGRAQVVFFEERMNAEAVMRLTLDRDLRKAIEREELVLHYQPKMDLATGRIRSAEALIRWRHPTRGLIPPSKFIALAEESGFIEQIGHWTLQQACAQMKAWRADGIVLDHVSVNVSPRQFRKRSLVNFITQCALNAGLKPSSLQVEITEGLLVERGDDVEGMLRQLADNGHEIALDDFGTGFSSMAYLKRFPVHAIKIDRVFIDGLERSADSEAIVSAIIAMSHALGKRVVAEGVETEEQLALLRRLRCDEIQGYLVAPGLAPEVLAEFLRTPTRHLAPA